MAKHTTMASDTPDSPENDENGGDAPETPDTPDDATTAFLAGDLRWRDLIAARRAA